MQGGVEDGEDRWRRTGRDEETQARGGRRRCEPTDVRLAAPLLRREDENLENRSLKRDENARAAW